MKLNINNIRTVNKAPYYPFRLRCSCNQKFSVTEFLCRPWIEGRSGNGLES